MDNPRKFICGLVMAVALAMVAPWAHAQQAATLSVKPLKGGVYWIEGRVGNTGGVLGNTGFIVGQNGVIVIDAKQNAELAKAMLAEIAKVTPKPVTHVILTHSDGDHVNGLAGFPAGLTIIAHENCKKEMENSLDNPNRQPGASSVITVPRDRLPNQLISKSQDLTIDGVRLKLLHLRRAHTGGDLMIYLSDQNIVFTGDVIVTRLSRQRNCPDALIKQDKSGLSEGWIESVKAMVALNAEIYVPGHGLSVQTREDLQKRLTIVEEKREKIGAMVAQGKSLDEIKAALGEAGAPAGRFPSFTEVVYKESSTKN